MLASLAAVDTGRLLSRNDAMQSRRCPSNIHMTWLLPLTRLYSVNRRGHPTIAWRTWKTLRVHDSIGGQSWAGKGI